MKIGITCYPGVGGSGILATRLGIEFAKRNHEVHFITYERPFGLHGADQENVQIHLVTVLDYPLFKYPPYTVALSSEMVKVARQYNLDVLNVHFYQQSYKYELNQNYINVNNIFQNKMDILLRFSYHQNPSLPPQSRLLSNWSSTI